MGRLEEISFSLADGQPDEAMQKLIEDARGINTAMGLESGPERIPGLVTTDGHVAWQFLSTALAQSAPAGETFCEWGSGIGIVSCMAKSLGWNVTGLEIEPRLVDISRDLAQRHTLEATFHLGSYKLENPEASFDTGLGFGLFDFDVIYAYLWPAEKQAMTAFVEKYARSGTVFLRYGGGLDCTAFRVNS